MNRRVRNCTRAALPFGVIAIIVPGEWKAIKATASAISTTRQLSPQERPSGEISWQVKDNIKKGLCKLVATKVVPERTVAIDLRGQP